MKEFFECDDEALIETGEEESVALLAQNDPIHARRKLEDYLEEKRLKDDLEDF